MFLGLQQQEKKNFKNNMHYGGKYNKTKEVLKGLENCIWKMDYFNIVYSL